MINVCINSEVDPKTPRPTSPPPFICPYSEIYLNAKQIVTNISNKYTY